MMDRTAPDGPIARRRPLGRSGIEVSALGLGCGPIGWLDTPDADDRAAATVDAALAAGITYFDVAPYYGHGEGERRLGAALASRRRHDVVVSTKVGRLIEGPAGDRRAVFDYSRDGTLRSLGESLERLRLDRIDVALVHDPDRWTHGDAQPERFREALEGAVPALLDLKGQGAVGAVGIGVNDWEVALDFVEAAPLDCVLLAGRHTLLEQAAARRFLPLCAERGVSVIVGGPFNSGILATGAVPGARYNYAPAPPEVLDRVRRIEAVCARFAVPLSAAAVRFPLRHPAVASVIPGADTPAQVEALERSMSLEIPDDLWAAIAGEGPTGPGA